MASRRKPIRPGPSFANEPIDSSGDYQTNPLARWVVFKPVQLTQRRLPNEPIGKMGGFQTRPIDGAAITKRTHWQAGGFSVPSNWQSGDYQTNPLASWAVFKPVPPAERRLPNEPNGNL
jgi:hypothetical protein